MYLYWVKMANYTCCGRVAVDLEPTLLSSLLISSPISKYLLITKL